MKTFRCKCGNRVTWSTDGVQPCQFCDKCGSTLARHPEQPAEPIPHQWATETVMEGDKIISERTYCTRCHERKP